MTIENINNGSNIICNIICNKLNITITLDEVLGIYEKFLGNICLMKDNSSY